MREEGHSSDSGCPKSAKALFWTVRVQRFGLKESTGLMAILEGSS